MSELSENNHTDRHGNDSTADGEQWTIINHIWIYTAPLILIFGICGNILTILVMRSQRMRGTSTSVYLTMLAAGDMTVIVVGLTPEWLSQLHVVDLWNVHPWVCKIELYMYYTALDFAIWTLVSFSCDRFIAVCFPLKKRQYCTVRRAVVAVSIVFMVSNLNMHVFWTRGEAFNNKTQQIENCYYPADYQYFEWNIRAHVVFVAAFLLPCVLICVWNGLIIARMMSTKDMRARTIQASERHKSAVRRMRKSLTQTTAMCISTSAAFVVLVLPNIILFIGKQWWEDRESYKFAKAISSQLVYVHHSINFVLYSLTGSRFRRELALLCQCSAPSEFIGTPRNLSLNSSERQSRPSSRLSSAFSSKRKSHTFTKASCNSPRNPRSPTANDTSMRIPLTTIRERNHNDFKQ